MLIAAFQTLKHICFADTQLNLTAVTSRTRPPVDRSILLPVLIHCTAALTVVVVRFTSEVDPDMLVALCVSTLCPCSLSHAHF